MQEAPLGSVLHRYRLNIKLTNVWRINARLNTIQISYRITYEIREYNDDLFRFRAIVRAYIRTLVSLPIVRYFHKYVSGEANYANDSYVQSEGYDWSAGRRGGRANGRDLAS